MTRPLRITLTTPYGPRRGEVARLGVDELSLVLEDQGPGPWRSGACAFALQNSVGPDLWGTLEVEPPGAVRDRRLHARILSVNGAQQARLEELASRLAHTRGAPDAAASQTVPTMPSGHGAGDGSITSVLALAIGHDGLEGFADLGADDLWSVSSSTGASAEPIAGRGAIRSALRRSLSDARWGRRRSQERSARLRLALGRGETVLGNDAEAPLPGDDDTPTDPG